MALVVDVDGVVSPVHGSTAWGDDVDGYARGGGIGHVPVSPRLNAALNELAARQPVVEVVGAGRVAERAALDRHAGVVR